MPRCRPRLLTLIAIAITGTTVLRITYEDTVEPLATRGLVSGEYNGVFKVPAVVPFVLLFESSSGSSWLMQLIGSHPQACTVGFEPIDNITMSSHSDHDARLHWLELLWRPLRDDNRSWTRWRAELQRSSVFGQFSQVSQSLETCEERGAKQLVAFGLKARLSRLLNDEASVHSLTQLAAALHVRIIRMTRVNRIKQALAEYNRHHAGRGQFKSASAGAGSVAVMVDLKLFARALREVERSHRLASIMLGKLLPHQPILLLTYEDLLSRHEETIRAVTEFLHLSATPILQSSQRPVSSNSSMLRKATPDRLCEAVSNYKQLCSRYLGTAYARFFGEACATSCSVVHAPMP